MTTSIMHGRGHKVCHHHASCKKLLVQLVLDLALDLFVDELVKPQCIYRRGNRKMVAQRAPVINLLVTGKFTLGIFARQIRHCEKFTPRKIFLSRMVAHRAPVIGKFTLGIFARQIRHCRKFTLVKFSLAERWIKKLLAPLQSGVFYGFKFGWMELPNFQKK